VTEPPERKAGPIERSVPIPRVTERGLILPAPGRLRRTSEVDYVDHYYGRGMGWVLRERLRWVKNALPREKVDAVLEIGYGSGVFLYELARHARMLVGVDVHPHAATVRQKLGDDGIDVTTLRASGMFLPFHDHTFDVVVIVSALEFMSDPYACLTESMRVTRPAGRVVCVTPRVLRWADAVYRSLAGVDPESDFRGGRQRVQRALADLADAAERRPRPRPLPAALAPYELVVLRPPG
jgi:SAM-dependent methyltransferase